MILLCIFIYVIYINDFKKIEKGKYNGIYS